MVKQGLTTLFVNNFMNGLSLELQYRRESNYDGEKRTQKEERGRSQDP